MQLPAYDEVHDDKIISEVQVRFAKETRQLRKLGFTEEFYIRETIPSSISFMWLFLLAYVVHRYFFSASVFRVNPLLHISTFNPYVIHEDGYAYTVMGNGRIKYATIFDDGTLLHTITGEAFKHSNMPQHRYLFQMPHPGDAAQSWQAHVKKVGQLVNEGRSVISPLRISDVIQMEMRADQILSGQAVDEWDDSSHKKNEF